eukprot:g10229.t1
MLVESPRDVIRLLDSLQRSEEGRPMAASAGSGDTAASGGAAVISEKPRVTTATAASADTQEAAAGSADKQEAIVGSAETQEATVGSADKPESTAGWKSTTKRGSTEKKTTIVGAPTLTTTRLGVGTRLHERLKQVLVHWNYGGGIWHAGRTAGPGPNLAETRAPGPNMGRIPVVQAAYKLHNPGLWARYAGYKRYLKEQLFPKLQRVRTAAANREANPGDHSTTTSSTTTTVPMWKVVPRCMFVEREGLADDLDSSLNEVFLVHGTRSATAAIGIAEGGLRMSYARGGVFGRAIYLAEDAGKSLGYTGNFMFVCRVALGRYKSQRLAGEDSAYAASLLEAKKRNGGDTDVGANVRDLSDLPLHEQYQSHVCEPPGGGHREFCLRVEEAIYPEYLLVLEE